METVKEAFTKPLKLSLEGFLEGLKEAPAGFFEPLVAFWRTAKSKAEGSALPDVSVKRSANTNLGEKTYLWTVVPLRLWIGYYLLYQGIRKYLRDFPHADWIKAQIGDLDKVEIYGWYKSFLTDVVVPNREVFGYLVMSGEILVGLCLVLGLLTRFSSIVGLFMLLNYYFGPGMARGAAVLAQQQTFIVALVVIFLSNAGRTLGLDSLLFKKK